MRRAGIRFEEEVVSHSNGGATFRIRLWPQVEGRDVYLVADFPDTYPYFPPQVRAPDESLGRHQHPDGGVLCLLGDDGDWRVGDSLADLVADRLEGLMAAAASPESGRTARTERRQGEPYADYYPYQSGAAVLVDGSWQLPSGPRGELVLNASLGTQPDGKPLLSGAVLEVKADGRQSCQAHPGAAQVLGVDRLRGRWVRMAEPVKELDPRSFLKRVIEVHPQVERPRPQRMGSHSIDVLGVLFPDELRWRQHDDNWVFVIRILNHSGKPKGAYFVRAHRAGRADLTERTPDLAPLGEASIAVFGLGALGAPATIEFARSGVGSLTLVDYDYVDAATASRWPYGLQVAGLPKTFALERILQRSYPYTAVRPVQWRLGGGSPSGYASELDALEHTIGGADLVVDATASVAAHHLLSDESRARGIPYVLAYATPGAWGGVIARVLPHGTTGCWNCLQYHIDAARILVPPGDPNAETQPAGCRSPTSTANGFDLQVIALAAVRLSVATLLNSQADDYATCGWDVATVTLREAEHVYPGAWAYRPLELAPECPTCSGD